MATRYDIFEALYTKGTAVSPPELLRLFQKPASAYAEIYQTLLRLQQEGLLQKAGKSFQIKHSPQSSLLYRLIRFSLANHLPYNALLERNMAFFIRNAWAKKIFSGSDFALNPRTLAKYVACLSKSGFLLIFSHKPLRATLLRHSFLKSVCAYHHLKIPPMEWPRHKEFWPLLHTELQLFRRLRRKNERKYLALVNSYRLRFIQHSLNLEGNPITLPETVKLLQHQVVPESLSLEAIEEVRNYQLAMGAMLQDVAEHQPLTQASILNYHYLALQHRPSVAGKIRIVAVRIKNNPRFTVAAVGEIQRRMTLFLQRYNQFIAKKKISIPETIHFAAYFHNEFQHIHPFLDGNSRITRLLTVHLFRSVGLPVIDIPLGLLEEYLASTKGAARRDDQRLCRILELVVLYNLRLFNEELKREEA